MENKSHHGTEEGSLTALGQRSGRKLTLRTTLGPEVHCVTTSFLPRDVKKLDSREGDRISEKVLARQASVSTDGILIRVTKFVETV